MEGKGSCLARSTIIDRTTTTFEANLRPVIAGPEIIACQKTVRKVPVPQHVVDYVLDMVRMSRPEDPAAFPFVKELVEWGPGPRACLYLVLGGKVRAVLHGRYYVTVDDVEALAHPVLRHRIVPTFNAEAEGMTIDAIIDRIVAATPKGSEAKVL